MGRATEVNLAIWQVHYRSMCNYKAMARTSSHWHFWINTESIAVKSWRHELGDILAHSLYIHRLMVRTLKQKDNTLSVPIISTHRSIWRELCFIHKMVKMWHEVTARWILAHATTNAVTARALTSVYWTQELNRAPWIARARSTAFRVSNGQVEKTCLK